jgi:hypothetical protein
MSVPAAAVLSRRKDHLQLPADNSGIDFFLRKIMVDDPTVQKGPAGKRTEPKSEAVSSDPDLSKEIERAVDRQPQDQVRCVRVFDNFYRCNWWSRLSSSRTPLDYNWAGLIMDCVRESRFLNATMQSGALVIKEIGPVAARQEHSAVEPPVAKVETQP